LEIKKVLGKAVREVVRVSNTLIAEYDRLAEII